MTNSPEPHAGTTHAASVTRIAMIAGRALAIATLGTTSHAATPPSAACTVETSLWGMLCLTLLVGLALLSALFGFTVHAHRAGAIRIASELNRESKDARLPAIAAGGPMAIAQLARSINAFRRRQAEREAEHLDVQASYAHDLRTPLTRMGLRCEMLEDAVAREAMERDLAEMRELVEASVASAWMQRIVAEPLPRVDADGLIGNLVRDYRDTGRVITLDGHIGRPVAACPLALRRVLANLIDNALRYGTNVRISARVDTRNLVLAVVDSGPGICPAQLDAVLSPWVRVQQGQEHKPGSGLGLAIARRLARSMQGELLLQNRRGGGLEARLTLPLAMA
ncbi:ATP-binding protein [Variovorax sp. J31P207]|uniref:sensor histidine kinase n=1 Tax=Variovorax sp. J31P207 TaxID=3053510 RepID=UPI002574AC80|nr:ATP-binding protein [Variovorax sp. J31P207]MDM0066607.1 ATP-binding protein [Variovorax sp. J31P207]